MNRDEARLILQACRPGGCDAADPYFAEAIALAQHDPELAAWFAEQQAFDARVAGSLRGIPVPSRFKAQILAQYRTEPPPVLSWWSQWFTLHSPAPWALATLILLVLGLALFWNHSPARPGFAEYSARMVNAAMQHQHHVDREVSDLKTALAWLGANHGANHLALPGRLDAGVGLTGCRVLTWQGQTVSMLCFRPGDGAHVDVFVTAAAIFPDPPPTDQPRFANCSGSPIVSWTHNGQAYLAVSHSDETILKNLWSPEKISRIHLYSTAQFTGDPL